MAKWQEKGHYPKGRSNSSSFEKLFSKEATPFRNARRTSPEKNLFASGNVSTWLSSCNADATRQRGVNNGRKRCTEGEDARGDECTVTATDSINNTIQEAVCHRFVCTRLPEPVSRGCRSICSAAPPLSPGRSPTIIIDRSRDLLATTRPPLVVKIWSLSTIACRLHSTGYAIVWRT